MQISVTVEGSAEAMAKLKKTSAGLADLSPAMKQVGTYLTNYFSGQAFASQGTVFGERWKRLNPMYEYYKDRQFPGQPILVRTGVMQRSFRAKSTANTTTITNKAPYFKYHQSDAPRKRLPRRVMMATNEAMRQQIYGIIGNYVRKAVAS